MQNSNLGFATRAIHLGYDQQANHGAVCPPLYLTSTFAFPTAEAGLRRFDGEEAGYIYGRLGNPTVAILEARLASLEGGEAALATASGMGAITTAFWTLIRPGARVLADITLYGCTYAFLREGLGNFGVNVEFADLADLASARKALEKPTDIVFFETPTNPNMRLIDIEQVSATAHSAGARVIVDNTYATPVLQRPLELGADIVVHSATKYLGGHGDLLAGAIVGSSEEIERMRWFGLKDMTGAVMSPFDAFLVLRGLKTLELRVARHGQTAAAAANFLHQHPAVKTVLFPGLETSPYHQLALKQMSGFGGMVAFELNGGLETGLRFMNALRLCTLAVSLGDAETLVQNPAAMTHKPYAAEDRDAHAISEGLIRLSAGLETEGDILADLDQALMQST